MNVRQKGNYVLAMDIARHDQDLLVVTENGYGKRTAIDEYPARARGAKGVKTITLTDRKGVLAAALVVREHQELVFISQNGMVQRTGVRGHQPLRPRLAGRARHERARRRPRRRRGAGRWRPNTPRPPPRSTTSPRPTTHSRLRGSLHCPDQRKEVVRTLSEVFAGPWRCPAARLRWLVRDSGIHTETPSGRCRALSLRPLRPPSPAETSRDVKEGRPEVGAPFVVLEGVRRWALGVGRSASAILRGLRSIPAAARVPLLPVEATRRTRASGAVLWAPC